MFFRISADCNKAKIDFDKASSNYDRNLTNGITQNGVANFIERDKMTDFKSGNFPYWPMIESNGATVFASVLCPIFAFLLVKLL